MIRRLSAPIVCALLGAVLVVHAKDKPADLRDEIAVKQESLRHRFRNFEEQLLTLSQRLARSDKPADRETAQRLAAASKLVGASGIKARFDTVVDALQKSKTMTALEINACHDQAEQILGNLDAIASLLLDDKKKPLTARELADIAARIDRAIQQQKGVQDKTDQDGKAKDLTEAQKALARTTEDIAKAMAGKGNDAKNKAGEDMPGKNHVDKAGQHQAKAGEDLGKGDKPAASGQQGRAIDNLQKARNAVAGAAAARRRAEIEILLITLQARCERLLQMQKEVHEGTVKVHKAGADRPKLDRPEEQKALALSDREGEIVQEAGAARKLLEDDGTAVAFARGFDDLMRDMRLVQKRLGRTDVGTVTQQIETDIIQTLEEMVAAFQKARQAMQEPAPPPPGAPPAGRPPRITLAQLVNLLAELKLVRSMETRVHDRTKLYGERYAGEQADDPDVRKELKDLGERQSEIQKVVKELDRRQQEEGP